LQRQLVGVPGFRRWGERRGFPATRVTAFKGKPQTLFS